MINFLVKEDEKIFLDSVNSTQHGHDESNKIVEDMEKTIAASLFDTYRVRNHLVPNPTNSKLIRLKKYENKNIWIFHLYTDLTSLF